MKYIVCTLMALLLVSCDSQEVKTEEMLKLCIQSKGVAVFRVNSHFGHLDYFECTIMFTGAQS